jgi:hypothetical protein
VEQFLELLENPSSDSAGERSGKYRTKPRINDSIGRTQSRKSRRAAASAMQPRPALNQTQSDPKPRFGTETRVQVQELSKAQAGKSSSIGTLRAVAPALAAILGMRRKA